MTITIIRTVFVLLTAGIGYYLAEELYPEWSWVGLILGFSLALMVIAAELALKRARVKLLAGAILGFVGGVMLANIATYSLSLTPLDAPQVIFAVRALLSVILGYVGILFGLRKGREFELAKLKQLLATKPVEGSAKLLDTSVIIDGRIADVCETGFLEGTFIVPQFILRELQRIADTQDPLKRAKGRRGLDILHRMQKMSGIDIRIVDEDFPKIRDVDSKLIALAQRLNAKIVTNDFNLNKVASLQGVTVLNINELSNAVKPVVLPGESLNVFILKEGKEMGQGVAYLEDGTMIVVENARKHIGHNVDVTVTSVLQTTAGRMIFTRLKEEPERETYQQAAGAKG